MGTLARLVLGSAAAFAFLVGIAGFILPFWINLVAADLPPPGDFGWAFLASAVETLPFGALPVWLGYVLARKVGRASPDVQAPPTPVAVAPAPIAVAPPLIAAAPASAAPPVRRKPALVFAGFGLLVVSLPIWLLVLFGLSKEMPTQKPIEVLAALLILAALAAPPALGLWLVQRGEPGIGARFLSDLRSGARGLLGADGLRRLFSTSVGLGAATAVASLALMYTLRPVAWLVALVALCGFAVADPALNLWRRSWWLGAVLSIGVWLILLTALASVADNLNQMRESTMVYLLPFMIYPGALALSGILRFVRWSSARARVPVSGGERSASDSDARTDR